MTKPACRSVKPAKVRKPRDAEIERMFGEGKPWREIASAVGMTYHSVRHRAYQLGLKRQTTKISKNPAQQTVWNRRYKARHPEKYAARKAVYAALVSGAMSREPCQRCGADELVQAHHHDYSRPLDVSWLCQACHLAEHGKAPRSQRVICETSPVEGRRVT